MLPYYSNCLAGTEFSVLLNSQPQLPPHPFYVSSPSRPFLPPSSTPVIFLFLPSLTCSLDFLHCRLRHTPFDSFSTSNRTPAIIPGLDSHPVFAPLSQYQKFAPNVVYIESIRLTLFAQCHDPTPHFPTTLYIPLVKIVDGYVPCIVDCVIGFQRHFCDLRCPWWLRAWRRLIRSRWWGRDSYARGKKHVADDHVAARHQPRGAHSGWKRPVLEPVVPKQ